MEEDKIQLIIPRRIFNDPRFLDEFIHLYAEIDNLQEDEMELTEEAKKRIMQGIKAVGEGRVISFDEMVKRIKERRNLKRSNNNL